MLLAEGIVTMADGESATMRHASPSTATAGFTESERGVGTRGAARFRDDSAVMAQCVVVVREGAWRAALDSAIICLSSMLSNTLVRT